MLEFVRRDNVVSSVFSKDNSVRIEIEKITFHISISTQLVFYDGNVYIDIESTWNRKKKIALIEESKNIRTNQNGHIEFYQCVRNEHLVRLNVQIITQVRCFKINYLNLINWKKKRSLKIIQRLLNFISKFRNFRDREKKSLQNQLDFILILVHV